MFARAPYTPSASALHYFTNTSPTPETSQMWSASNGTNEEYDSPKSGALPTFQRLTSNAYYSNGRNAHVNYGAPVVSIIFPFSNFQTKIQSSW